MAGKNWKSKTRTWTDTVHEQTKEKARTAIKLRKAGKPVTEIAKALKLSKSRIYEYLRTK
jgi:DNA invertase Pin-like site-specific DNA recombinase